ncbi:hypothetical protein HDK64DRAFT_266217 [Phyllosticta capitalensis]
MAPDLNSITTAGAASATSGHQQAQNTHLATSQQQPTSRSSTSRNTSNRSSPNHSRRTSQLSSMNPPPLPLGHSNSTAQQHQNQQTYAPFPPLSPHMSAAGPAPNGRARAGSSAGAEMEAGVPMRHPRPLTAAELHHELELEQEAVVNRLTRELSALRAHSASVASTTSVSSMSTSTSLQGSLPHLHPPVSAGTPFPLFEATGDPLSTGAAHHAGALTGPTHPSGTASRHRDRSSSSVSRSGGVTTSAPTLSHSVGGGAGAAPGVGLGVYGHGGQHRYSISSPGGGSSTSNSNNANATAPTTGSSSGALDGSASSSSYAGGVALARSPSLGVQGGGGAGAGHVSRFEETALHRQELEEAKRENELLRKRIRELEAELRGRRRASSAAAGAASANGTAAAGEGTSAAQATSPRQPEADAAAAAAAAAAASADGS